MNDSFVPGCFGKLPVAADFIGHHSHDDDSLALEQWLREGVGLARQRFGSQSEKLLREMGETRFFLWWRDASRPLIGTMVPGKDRSGRNFPFALFLQATSPTPTAIYAAYPLLFEGFLSEGRKVATTPWSEIPDFLRVVDEMGGLAPDIGGANLPRPADRFGDRTIRLVEVGSAAGAVSRGAAALWTLVAPRRTPANAQAIGVRFPVPGVDLEGSIVACFWLEMTKRILPVAAAPPLCLWSLEDGTGRGYLDVHFRQPGGLGFLHLLDPALASDRLYPILDRDAASPRVGGQIGAEALRLLGDPSLSLLAALDLVAADRAPRST